MNGRKIFVIGMCIGLFVTGFQLGAQPVTVSFDKSTQDYLMAQMKAGRSEVIGQWAVKNPSLLNGRGPTGDSPLDLAVKQSAVSSFTVLLDNGADPNALRANWNSEIFTDLLILIHEEHPDDLSLMRNFSQSLLAHGFRWDNKNSLLGVQVGTAGALIILCEETGSTVAQLIWLATQGMPTSYEIRHQGVLYAETLERWALAGEKTKFAKVMAQLAIEKAELEEKQEKLLEEAFLQKGSALGKFYGKDEDDNNQRLLKNPNAFKPGAGYYFGNVIPYKWLTREKVVCYAEDLSIIGNKGQSEMFLIYIEDPELRRSFTPSELSAGYGQPLTLGFDVILVPYDDPLYTTWAGFKLIAMKPVKFL